MQRDIKNRRVIYLSDQEWADIQRWASEVGISASAYIRGAVDSLTAHVSANPLDHAVAKVNAQAERDRILNAVNRKGSGA